MKLDKLLLKRFNELMDQAKKVEATTSVTDVAATVDAAKYHEWAASALNLLLRVCGEKSPYCTGFHAIHSKIIYLAYREPFDNCRAIFKAAKEDYEKGLIFELRCVVKKEILSYLTRHAEKLLNSGQKDAACIIAGQALETALQELCTRAHLPHDRPELMNAELGKAGTYGKDTQNRIAGWAELRARGLGGDFDRCDREAVMEMVRGTEEFTEEHLS